MCLKDKQKRTGNSFAAAFEAFDRQLRREGYPTSDLRREGRRLLAPGITIKDYIDTLRAVESVEEVGGVIQYRQRTTMTEDGIAAIIYDEFQKGESAQWYRTAAHRIFNDLAVKIVKGTKDES